MLCKEIITVGSEVHKKHINVLCGQDVQLFNIKAAGAGSIGRAFYGVGLLPLAC